MVDNKNRYRYGMVFSLLCGSGYMVHIMTQANKIKKALMKAVSDCDRLEIIKALKRLEMEKNRWKNGKARSISG